MVVGLFLSECVDALLDLNSFPTRRSSDLAHHTERAVGERRLELPLLIFPAIAERHPIRPHLSRLERRRCQDRKSTRLNSSHGYISYAVFCLKKKNAKGLGLHLPMPLVPKN